MNERTQNLAYSLVGSSIDFSFKKKLEGATPIDENIRVEKSRISKNVELAHSAGGSLCVALLGEMTSRYMKELYYMAVRSSIEMRRYRPLVLEYLKLSTEERAEKLKEFLRDGIPARDKNRDAIVEAVRYFTTTYGGRLKEFRKLLTREEFLIIA